MRLINADALVVEITENPPVYNVNRVVDVIKSQPTIDGWISVKDKMPMLVETVLFTGKRYDGGWFGTKRGYFDGTDWYADDEGTIYSTTPVTHWRPLPSPPEED
jgi:hypothetical protein